MIDLKSYKPRQAKLSDTSRHDTPSLDHDQSSAGYSSVYRQGEDDQLPSSSDPFDGQSDQPNTSFGGMEDLVKKVTNSLPSDLTTKSLLFELAKYDPYLWVMVYRRIKGRKTIYDMSVAIDAYLQQGIDPTIRTLIRHRPFLIQPLRDQSQYKTYRKSRQVGISENVLSEELFFLSTHDGTKWMHTFPRMQQLADFSNTRIVEALSETPQIKRLLGVPNQVLTKRIGNSYLFLRSAWEADLGEGVDVDGVSFDEKDRMKEGIEVAFKESLAASAYGMIRDISTPSLPGVGVDVSYSRSKQYEWHVQCTKCSRWQTIEYPKNFLQVIDYDAGEYAIPKGAYVYACEREDCRGHLDRYKGKYIARYPDREVSGYQISQLAATWISATEIMQKKIDYKFESLWLNYVLGVPSFGESILIRQEDFANAVCDYAYPIPYRTRDFDHIAVGIDWGGDNYIIIAGINASTGRSYLLRAAVVRDTKVPLESTKQIVQIIAPYEPDIIIADAGYGKERNDMLYSIFNRKFWICQYNTSSVKRQTNLNPQWNQGSAKVVVDRTTLLKASAREIRLGHFGFPSPEYREVKQIFDHFCNLAPVIEEEDGEVWEVIKETGPDHFAHAMSYMLLGQSQITQTGAFDFSFL